MENAKPEASVPGEPKLNGFNQQEISEDDIYTDDLFDIEQFAANEELYNKNRKDLIDQGKLGMGCCVDNGNFEFFQIGGPSGGEAKKKNWTKNRFMTEIKMEPSNQTARKRDIYNKMIESRKKQRIYKKGVHKNWMYYRENHVKWADEGKENYRVLIDECKEVAFLAPNADENARKEFEEQTKTAGPNAFTNTITREIPFAYAIPFAFSQGIPLSIKAGRPNQDVNTFGIFNVILDTGSSHTVLRESDVQNMDLMIYDDIPGDVVGGLIANFSHAGPIKLGIPLDLIGATQHASRIGYFTLPFVLTVSAGPRLLGLDIITKLRQACIDLDQNLNQYGVPAANLLSLKMQGPPQATGVTGPGIFNFEIEE